MGPYGAVRQIGEGTWDQAGECPFDFISILFTIIFGIEALFMIYHTFSPGPVSNRFFFAGMADMPFNAD